VVGAGVVLVVVDTHDNSEIFARGRGRNDDLLGSSGEVGSGLLCVREEPSGFDDDVNAERRPRKFAGVAFCEHRDLLAVYRDKSIARGDLDGKSPVHRVIFEQVSQRLGVRQIIDSDDVQLVGACQRCAKETAADTTESIDGNRDHGETSFQGGRNWGRRTLRPLSALQPYEISRVAEAPARAASKRLATFPQSTMFQNAFT